MTTAFVRSAQTVGQPNAIELFLAEQRGRFHVETEIIPLEAVDGWLTSADADSIEHSAGAFFGIIGLRISSPERHWDQPMIDQPEIGVLGMAVRIRNGVMECLLQAKAEPGTVGGVQVGPTVQATRSNFTRRHGGRAVPYLEQFLGDAAAVQGFDIAQSEQGTRFLRKLNRNIVTFVEGDLPLEDGYTWSTVGDIHRALRAGDFVNFDARTVLSGLSALEAWRAAPDAGHDYMSRLLSHSLGHFSTAAHDIDDLVVWLREARHRQYALDRVPIWSLNGWVRRRGQIEHEERAFFRVVGARMHAVGREVDRWCQPLIAEDGVALLGLAVTVIDGIMHVLLRASREPGLLKGVELGPTVQIVPETFGSVPALHAPEGLDLVNSGGGSVLYDQTLSGEGGRFYKARQRHLITLIDPIAEPPEHRWVSLHQFSEFVRRGQIVNEQARSLFTCLMSLLTPPAPEDK